MAPKCYICNHYVPKNVSLFRLPDRNDEFSQRCWIWLKLLDEKTENMHKIRVCSEHFLNRKPARSGDYLDIDWVPNKNLGRFSQNWKGVEYHLRAIGTNQVPNLQSMKLDENHLIGVDINASTKTGNSPLYNDKPNKNSQISAINNLIGSDPKIITNINNDNSAIKSNNLCQSTIFFPIQDHEASSVKTIGQAALNTVLNPVKKRRIFEVEQLFFFSKEIQTDVSFTDIDMLFQYYQEAVEERDKLLLKISTLVIDVGFFKENDKKTRFYTGLPTWTLFKNFYEMIEDYLPTHPKCKLSRFQMVALTLMKLRLNQSFTDLGYRFQIDETTASRYFHRCIYILFKLFNDSKLLHWPSRQNLLQNTPSYFRSIFKDAVTVIIDCFEIFSERPSLLRAAAQGFSVYKHHATLKFLIGISITGVIIFISIAFGGRASDKEIVLQSNFLEKLQPHDVVLADKGFLVEKEVEEKDASLKIPSFVRNVTQLRPNNVEESRNIARIRIHVERVICQLKAKFNICTDIAQMSAISKQNCLFDRDLYDKILLVCSCLVNMCPSVVPNNFEM